MAAATLGVNLYLAILIFGIGVVTATSPMMANALGRKLHSVRDVRRTFRQGLWTAVMIAVPSWILLWHAEAILILFDQEPELAAAAQSFVHELQWGLLPALGYIVLRSFVAALERPIWALMVTGTAIAFNIAANWVLVFGNLGFPALGIVGSGLATSFASFIMFFGMVAVVMTHRQFRRYHLLGRFWRADWPRFRALLKLGAPISGILAFEVTIFNAAAFLMGLIGAAQLAAHAIALQISSVTFMIPLGLAQAATVRVGLAFGARDTEGISRAGWTALAMGVSFMALMAIVMITLPKLLIGVFIDIDDPANTAVIGFAVTFLAFAALFQVADGAQAVAAGMLRGLQDTTVPMIYAAIGYWGIGLVLGVALAFWFGFDGNGIWIGLCTGLAVVSVLLIYRWLQRNRLGLSTAYRPVSQ